MVGEGTGARDMVVGFLKDGVGEGGGVVDGLSLAIQAPSTDESKCRDCRESDITWGGE